MGEGSRLGANALSRATAERSLHDPALPAEALQQIAAGHPALWDAVAGHPGAYPELVEWIRALRAHGYGAQPVPPVPATPSSAPRPQPATEDHGGRTARTTPTPHPAQTPRATPTTPAVSSSAAIPAVVSGTRTDSRNRAASEIPAASVAAVAEADADHRPNAGSDAVRDPSPARPPVHRVPRRPTDPRERHRAPRHSALPWMIGGGVLFAGAAVAIPLIAFSAGG